VSSIRVNGEPKSLDVATVDDLLRAEEIDPAARFVAVAVNGVVIPRGRWDSEQVKDGDDIEIVRPAPGG
jgi:sulfur carrier protein